MISIEDWLLEPENPSVRFWALHHLQGLKLSDPEPMKLQEKIMSSSTIQKILSTQDPKGFWISSDNMYLPKYKASTHSLLILAELGAQRNPLRLQPPKLPILLLPRLRTSV